MSPCLSVCLSVSEAQAEALLTSLRSRIKDHMLRRTKKDLDAEDREAMPTKHDVVVWHRLSKQQLDVRDVRRERDRERGREGRFSHNRIPSHVCVCACVQLYGMYLQGSEMNDAKAFKQGAGDHYSKVLKVSESLAGADEPTSD